MLLKEKVRGLSSRICKTLIQSSCFEKAACNIIVGVYGKSNREISDLPVNTAKLYRDDGVLQCVVQDTVGREKGCRQVRKKNQKKAP